MNWVHRKRFTGIRHFLRAEGRQLDPGDHSEPLG